MRDRLDYIDGLRGIAVGMVLVSHAFGTYLTSVPGIGAQGVSLFFVLSGFCLSYGPLQRRHLGKPGWFNLRRYAVARCRRILPPYYAALALFVPLNLFFAHRGWNWPGVQTTPTVSNIIAHLLLVHNFSWSWIQSIDGPMWSLATEWQWYFVFPCMLYLCVQYPRLAVLLSFLIAFGCIFTPLSGALIGGYFVPIRLVEFCLGILVARAVVEQRPVPPLPIVGAVVLAGLIVINAAAQTPVVAILYYPLCGVTFACLVLLTARVRWLNAMCSWERLVRLGVISYSVYLIHYPLVMGTQLFFHFWPVWITGPLGIVIALPISYGFFFMIERPLLTMAGKNAAHRHEIASPLVPQLAESGS